MANISKKAMVEEALKKYTSQKIEEATKCEVTVLTKDGSKGVFNFGLSNRGIKTKQEKIKSYIWGYLKNDAADEYNKRPNWNTNRAENCKKGEIK